MLVQNKPRSESILFLFLHTATAVELVHEVDGVSLFLRCFRPGPVDFAFVTGVIADPHGAEVALGEGADAVQALEAVIRPLGASGATTVRQNCTKNGLQVSVDHFLCGESEIRTRDTLLGYTRFPGVPLQPLEHLSNTGPETAGVKTGLQR